MAKDEKDNDSDCLLRFVDVHKDYGEDGSALCGMNLDIHAGEFLTLLGPSGGGKSTALMMLAGFDTPTAGDILYKGQSIADIPAHRRNFGVVFQSRALFPHLTALQNVAYPLRMRGVSRSEASKRAREALTRVHLASLGHPLAVDPRYGGRDKMLLSDLKAGYRPKPGRSEKPLIDRLTLHARSVRLTLLGGKELTIEADYPKDLRVLLSKMEKWRHAPQEKPD